MFDGLRTSITVTTRLPDLRSMISMKPCRMGSSGCKCTTGGSRALGALPATLDYSDVGDNIPRPSLRRFHEHAIVHPREQVARQ